MLLLQRAWVRSLVGELRSFMLLSVAKKKKKKNPCENPKRVVSALLLTEFYNGSNWNNKDGVAWKIPGLGRRNLVCCSPWGRSESDMTERLPFHFSLSCIGEGNGNPLRWSCLENPRDRGAWWGTVYGVAQSQTRLKRLSSSSSRFPKVSQLVGVRVRIRIRTQKCSSICLNHTTLSAQYCIGCDIALCGYVSGLWAFLGRALFFPYWYPHSP